MSVLEETGLIVPAGKLFLRAICSQIQEWRNRGGREILVCVNVSARQFLSPDLGAIVNDILHEFNIPARLLELEITESCVMVNAEEAVRTLDYLRSLGVAIAIDDFGTGYSSLAYLKRFPLSALKIDKSFIRDITTDSENAAITQAIVSMGHALGLSVIAEGVETREQLGFLRDCSCDLAQGYFFARPMPPLECERAIVEDDGLRCQ
jgi:EAL domain-containing protein (putative c-di-GMP-specific phosphodiesterase class I)